MKLTLKNFKYHRNREIILPDKGLNLLSGESGAGKTTILNAIFYAFYGKVKKPYSHGRTTCTVELEYRDLNISRTSNPNKLIVKHKDREYEDDAAQGVIEQVLGMNLEEFRASSYIVQRLENSVLSMTPSDQQKFMETLVFSDNIHIEYKKKIHDLTKEYQKSKTRIEGQISLLEEQLEEKKANLPDKVKTIDKDKIEEVKNEQESCNIQISHIQDKIQEIQNELQDLRDTYALREHLIEEKKKLEIEIQHLEKNVNEIGTVPSTTEIEKLDNDLKKLKIRLDNTQHHIAYQDSKEQLDNLTKEHFASLQNSLDDLKKQLIPSEEREKLKKEKESISEKREEYERISSEVAELKNRKDYALTKIKEVLKEVKKYYKISKVTPAQLKKFIEENIDLLSKKLVEAEESLDKLKKEKIYFCPKCKSNLTLQNDALAIKKGAPLKKDYKVLIIEQEGIVASHRLNIDILSKQLEKLNEVLDDSKIKIPVVPKFSLEDASDIIEKVKDIEKQETEIQTLKEQINKKILPKSLETLNRDVKSKRNKFPKNFKVTLSVDECQNKISEYQKTIDESQRQRNEIDKLTKEIQNRNTEIKKIDGKIGTNRKLPSNAKNEMSRLEKELNNFTKEMTKYTNRLTELQKDLELIQKYNEYQRAKKEVAKLEGDIVKIKENAEIIDKKLEGCLGLEKTCEEAQILAMKQKVTSLNTHASLYLDAMFEDPITVRLETKASNKFTTYIEYKGSKYNSVDEFSGGEKQRCDLAFMLAVNDMVGSNIIMLDECLNNLNASINMDVLSYLKDLKAETKLILVVSHEAVEGVFDDIINI